MRLCVEFNKGRMLVRFDKKTKQCHLQDLLRCINKTYDIVKEEEEEIIDWFRGLLHDVIQE